MPRGRNKKRKNRNKQQYDADAYPPAEIDVVNDENEEQINDDALIVDYMYRNTELKKQVAALEKQIDRIAANNNKLKEDMEHLQQSNLDLEKKNKKLETSAANNSDLKKEMEHLQNTNKRLKMELAHHRSYKILKYEPADKKDVKTRSEIKTQQMRFAGDFRKHRGRLTKWNELNDKLQKIFENNNDDQKDDDKNDFEVLQLLGSYKNCMELLHQQQSKAEDIGEYVVRLSKSKKDLKNILKEYTTNRQPLQEKYNGLGAMYTNWKSQRINLEDKVANMMGEINKIAEKENKLNKEKTATMNVLNVWEIEQRDFEELLKHCKSITAKYHVFEKNVDDKADELRAFFKSKWDLHERRWTEWNVNGIICWIEFLIYDNKIKLSKDVDLKKVEQEMRSQKITGKSLGDMEKTDLKLFGLTVFDDMTQIYKQIRELVSKYPDIADNGMVSDGDDSVEGGVHVTRRVQIPDEYICPISGKIMINPIIYDGITYDKQTFLDYVKQYKKIPNSEEAYDEDEGMFKNKKLKQKIDAFLSVNPQFVNEGV